MRSTNRSTAADETSVVSEAMSTPPVEPTPTSTEAAAHTAESTMAFREVMRDRPVRLLTMMQLFISTGVFLQAAVLGKQVFDITDRELDLGLLGLAEFLPSFLLVLVTGSVIDRFDRKKVALTAFSLEICCSLALMFYARSNPTRVWPLFLIAVIFGVARAFSSPATRVMSPMVAPEGGFTRVIAIHSATWTTAIILGPAASGFLYTIDPWVAYAVGAALIVLGAIALLQVRFRRAPQRPDPSDRPSLHSALEGLRFIRRTPILLAAISLDLFAVLFGGAVALLPAIAEKRLGVGDVAYGWLRAAGGIGAAVMAVFIAIKPFNRRVGPILLSVVAVFGAGTVVLGLTRTYVVAFIAMMVLSAADMVSVYIRSTLVPLATPPSKQGRVTSVENVFIGASNELGAFESGLAAAILGTATAVVLGGVATLVVVGVFAVVFPTLRRVDRFPEPAE